MCDSLHNTPTGCCFYLFICSRDDTLLRPHSHASAELCRLHPVIFVIQTVRRKLLRQSVNRWSLLTPALSSKSRTEAGVLLHMRCSKRTLGGGKELCLFSKLQSPQRKDPHVPSAVFTVQEATIYAPHFHSTKPKIWTHCNIKMCKKLSFSQDLNNSVPFKPLWSHFDGSKWLKIVVYSSSHKASGS